MKKIMFNDEFLLTKAVLDGRKTQTRRIVPQKELDKINLFQEEYYDSTFDKLEGVELLTHYFLTEKCGKLPYNVGEVVAVSQRMCDVYAEWDMAHLGKDTKALMEKFGGSPCFNNKMFVKASEMPHQIRMTNVRVEKLQDISDDDCLKEGLEWDAKAQSYYAGYSMETGKKNWLGNTPREAFDHLINKVSRKDVWEENPYVFVYDFELVK